MSKSKFVGEGLTYDDVLLVPSYSEIIPSEVSLKTKFSRNINLNIPIVSAAMDTVTESKMAIAIASEGGIGVIHKNLSTDDQCNEVRLVKRAESGMIIDPVTLTKDSLVIDAKNNKTLIISSQDEEIIAKADLKIDLDKKPVPLVTDIRKNRIK